MRLHTERLRSGWIAAGLACMVVCASACTEAAPKRAPVDRPSDDDDDDGESNDEVDTEPTRPSDGKPDPAKDSGAKVDSGVAKPKDAGQPTDKVDADTGSAESADAGVRPTGDAGGTPDAGQPGAARPLSTTLKFPTTKESPKVAPYFNVYRPTDLNVTGQPLPVFVWANGGCVRGDDSWVAMFTRWAGSGMVVLALTSKPNGTLFDQSTADDHKGMVDWAFAENAKQSSPYFGKLDTAHIAAGGNSCGGVTALQTAAADSRVTSVFVLSGSSQLPGASEADVKKVVENIKAPVLYIEGSKDDISRENAENDYKLYKEGHPVAFVTRSTGDHQTISTDSGVLADAAEIGLNWFDLSFFGSKAAGDVLRTPTVCATCKSGVWALMAKHLETLEK